jgi:uncharacterized membrane protein
MVGTKIKDLLDSDTSKIVAKRLWPSMLFLIVMSVISATSIAFFNERGSVSWYISYWIFFLLLCCLTVIGALVFMMDARIMNAKDRMANGEES